MSTLYFVRGVASAEQIALAKKVGAKIRNSGAYHDDDFIESCESVMGDIPEGYTEIETHKAHPEAVKLVEPKAEPEPKK